MAVARGKGIWMRGMPVLGYDVASEGGRLVVNREEAPTCERYSLYTWLVSQGIPIQESALGQGWTRPQSFKAEDRPYAQSFTLSARYGFEAARATSHRPSCQKDSSNVGLLARIVLILMSRLPGVDHYSVTAGGWPL